MLQNKMVGNRGGVKSEKGTYYLYEVHVHNTVVDPFSAQRFTASRLFRR